MKKIIIFFSALLLVSVVALYFSLGYLLTQSTNIWFDRISKKLNSKGIETTYLHYDTPKYSLSGNISWNNVSTEVLLSKNKTILDDVKVHVFIREVKIDLKKAILGQFSLKALESEILQIEGKKKEKEILIRGDFFKAQTNIKPGLPNSIKSQAKNIFKEIFRFINKGETTIPTEFIGSLGFKLKDGRNVSIRVWVVEENNAYYLRVSEEDLMAVSKNILNEEISQEEVSIVAKYPLRAPRLLKVKRDARSVANEAHDKNKDVPKDAYRHVWWSYTLTKLYGEDFAKLITDAHEVGSTTNTEKDHIMDYNNNEIGRHYAKKGYNEGEILKRLMSDSRVIRSTRDI